MNLLLKIFCLVSFACCIPGSLFTQHPFDASWQAGILGMNQNPASIATAPFPREFTLGALDMSAQNNLFQSNDIRRISPLLLFGNLSNPGGTQLLSTNIQGPDFTGLDAAAFHSFNSGHFQYPAYSFQLKDNPDLVERGLARRVVAIRLERRELFEVYDLDARLAKAYAAGFENQENLNPQDDYFHVKVRDWDALAGNFGVSLGKGKNLLHIVVGAKLLSSATFLDFKAYGTEVLFLPDNHLILSSDSLAYAYNNSFAEATRPDGKRRYQNFEASFGFSGELGIIYQVNNINRQPIYEFGASIQDMGVIQYWNLKNTRYELSPVFINYDQIDDIAQGAEASTVVFDSLSRFQNEKGAGITEKLPLRITTHAKMKLGKKGWALQLRGDFRKDREMQIWQNFFRATLSYEGKKFAIFFPYATASAPPHVPLSNQAHRLGVLISLGNRLMLGSNDILTNTFNSGTRKGVRQTHIFMGLRFPLIPKD